MRIFPVRCADFRILKAIKVEHQIRMSSLWSHFHLQSTAPVCLILSFSLFIVLSESIQRLREWEMPFITSLICGLLCVYICTYIHTMCKRLQMTPGFQHLLWSFHRLIDRTFKWNYSPTWRIFIVFREAFNPPLQAVSNWPLSVKTSTSVHNVSFHISFTIYVWLQFWDALINRY